MADCEIENAELRITNAELNAPSHEVIALAEIRFYAFAFLRVSVPLW